MAVGTCLGWLSLGFALGFGVAIGIGVYGIRNDFSEDDPL
jgi:hypothetical protein